MKKYSKYQVFILSSRSGGPLNQHKLIAHELRKKGIKVEHYSGIWGWLKLHFIYGENNIIITNVPLLIRFYKKNFFFNIHGNYFVEKDIIKNPLGFLYGLNKLWSQKIILPTQYLKRTLSLKNGLVIPNALSKNLIYQKIPACRQAGKTKNYSIIKLIMVTTFMFKEKAQGVLKVIKILSQIKTKKIIELDIYGKGHFQDEIIGKTKKVGLPENIKINFKGFSKNIYQKLKQANIFVYWSSLDVMPIVLMEAEVFGLPIIANNFPSFKEFVDSNNFIVKNEKEFKKALETLINKPDKILEIGRKNRQSIKKFDITKIINLWTKLIFNQNV